MLREEQQIKLGRLEAERATRSPRRPQVDRGPEKSFRRVQEQPKVALLKPQWLEPNWLGPKIDLSQACLKMP